MGNCVLLCDVGEYEGLVMSDHSTARLCQLIMLSSYLCIVLLIIHHISMTDTFYLIYFYSLSTQNNTDNAAL